MRIHRPLNARRRPADRDPLFPGVWYGSYGALLSPEPEREEPPPKAEPLLGTPEHPETQAAWKRAADKADAVMAAMRQHEPAFDPSDVYAVVTELLDTDFTPDDVVAAYRKCREAKS